MRFLAALFVERFVSREFDSQGREKSRESSAHEITILFGRPYRRLIERDGHPLKPQEEKKQQEKLAKVFAEGQRESESQREKRLAEYQNRRQRGREFLREITEAYDFRLLGEETVGGRPAYMIAANPRPGYQPRDPRAKIRGKLWIDKAELQWVKADLDATDTLSFGLFHAEASARLALLKKAQGDLDVAYSNYRKFQSATDLTPVAEAPSGHAPNSTEQTSPPLRQP